MKTSQQTQVLKRMKREMGFWGMAVYFLPITLLVIVFIAMIPFAEKGNPWGLIFMLLLAVFLFIFGPIYKVWYFKKRGIKIPRDPFLPY
jgi:hypothetical protein